MLSFKGRRLVICRLRNIRHLKPETKNAVSGPYAIGQSEYFAMGDNSPGSHDSRSWGTVPGEYVMGKAVFLFWPFPPFSEQFRPGLVR